MALRQRDHRFYTGLVGNKRMEHSHRGREQLDLTDIIGTQSGGQEATCLVKALCWVMEWGAKAEE